MLKLAIDFGTAMTKIFRIGSGVVLAEATCVTVRKDTGEIRAFGNEAKRLLGKTADATDVCFPVYEGEIVAEKLAAPLLEYFIRKIAKTSAVDALFCVPCGCSAGARDKLYRVAKMAGISRVSFAETPFLGVLGQDFPLNESNPVFAIDLGAGVTSIAAFSLGGMIAGVSMNVGGNNMDVHIIDQIAEHFALKIGSLTSEKLKITIGSLIPDDNQGTVIIGRDIETGKPRSVFVNSSDIEFPIRIYVDKIIEYAELVLKRLPAEVSAAVGKNGLYLSGGLANLAGLPEYMGRQLQMEVHYSQDPQTAVVLGGGRAIGNSTLLKRIRMD